MKYQFGRKGALVCFSVTLSGHWAHAGEKTTRVELQESNEALANPGRGWQIFHTIADHQLNSEKPYSAIPRMP